MPYDKETLTYNYAQMREQVEAAANKAKSACIPKMVAVSKRRSIEEICSLAELGQVDFGESYVSEAVDKIAGIDQLNLGQPLVWHFVGALQSNKTHLVAQYFHWVHSISRVKIAARLSAQRPKDLPPLNICIQVNIDQSEKKSGVVPEIEAIKALGVEIAQFKNIRWRGLMCIPDTAGQVQTIGKFKKMAYLFENLKQDFDYLDVLSMGMSKDYDWAIQEGATHVRVGTKIFGPRNLD